MHFPSPIIFLFYFKIFLTTFLGNLISACSIFRGGKKSKKDFLEIENLCICLLCVEGGLCMCHNIYVGVGGQFEEVIPLLPSPMEILGIELWSLDLAASTITH